MVADAFNAGLLEKAQEDAEKLRSVVMPMEHEIAALKAKLSSADDRVKELEASKVSWRRISPNTNLQVFPLILGKSD